DDFDLGRLAGFAQQRDLVDRAVGFHRAVLPHRLHSERGEGERLGLADPRKNAAAAAITVHQEADRAEIEPVSGYEAASVDHLVQYLQHEAVAAEHHRAVGL